MSVRVLGWVGTSMCRKWGVWPVCGTAAGALFLAWDEVGAIGQAGQKQDMQGGVQRCRGRQVWLASRWLHSSRGFV